MFTSCYLLLLLSLFFPSGRSQETSWAYKGATGTDTWAHNYVQCDPKNNWRQSPIDIKEKIVYFDPAVSGPSLGPKYTQPVSGTLLNNVETAKFIIPRSENVHFWLDNGAGVTTKYMLDSGHFHWGENLHAGSEHTLDGVRYFGEMHLVHYLAELDNLTMALDVPDAVAVIGVFLEVSDCCGVADTAAFTYLLNKFSSIHSPGDTTDIQMTIRDLLPTNFDTIYTYHGGLTTPTCNGVVKWIVLQNTMKITSALSRSAFQQNVPQDDHAHAQGDNFRPLQDPGKRLILTNDRSYKWIAADGSTVLPKLSTVLIAALFVLFVRW